MRKITNAQYTDNPATVAAGKQFLDCYVQDDHVRGPVMLLVHGGAWQAGQKEYFDPVATAFASEGITTVLNAYRLERHPAGIEDVALAFKWCVDHLATDLAPNDGRIFIAGHSAGGHLISLLATDPQWLAGVGLASDRIAGVIPVSAFLNFGQVPVVDGLPVAQCSPTQLVRPGLPKHLVLYADNDLGGLGRQAVAHWLALSLAGVPVQILMVAPRDHTSILYGMKDTNDPASQAIFAFTDGGA